MKNFGANLGFAALLLLSFGSVRPAAGQTTPPAPGEVREVKPEIIKVRDDNGELRAIPNITLEKLDEMFRKLDEQKAPPLSFVLTQLQVQGRADDRRAQLRVEFQITLKRTGWVRVPLRLNNALLREPPASLDPAKFLIAYDRDTDGYVAWINAAADSKQTVALDVSVPLTRVGDETRLVLVAPRATSSTMNVSVNASGIVGLVSPGAELVKTEASGGQTTFEALGIGGEFQLAWREDRPTDKLAPLLQATTEALFKIDNKRRLSGDVLLTVRSFGEREVDSFQVRLPTGLDIVPDQAALRQPNYSVTVGAAMAGERPVVTVKFNKKSKEPEKVRLFVDAKSTDNVETADWEIVGAIRNSGVLDFQAEGDWSIEWLRGPNVRRAEELPDVPKPRKPIARFEYSGPSSLKLRITPKETRVRIEPVYVLHLDAQQARLAATWTSRTKGKTPPSLDLAVAADWQVDRVTVNGAEVQAAPISDTQKDTLRIPLGGPAATDDGFTVHLDLHRDAQANASFHWPLPQPIAAESLTVSPAALLVVPATNVELLPEPAAETGLRADHLPPTNDTLKELLAKHPAATLFQHRGPQPAAFGGELRVRPRSIAVATGGSVLIAKSEVQVQQRFKYQVLYEPARQVLIDVPRKAESLRVFPDADGVRLAPVMDVPNGAGPEHRRVAVDLIDPRLGSFELLVRYDLPTTPIDMQDEAALSVALAVPTDDVTQSHMKVTFPEDWAAEPEGDDWREDPSEATPAAGVLQLVADDKSDSLPLRLSPAQRGTKGPTVVTKAWLQTVLLGDQRRDRAVIRFSTKEPRLRLQLPSDVRTNDLVIAVNGRQVDDFTISDHELQVPLEADSAQEAAVTEFVVELSYWFDEPTEMGSIAPHAPRVLGASPPDRSYWQLVTSRDRHVLGSGAGLTPESDWRPRGLFWSRETHLNQADLESWIGASTQAVLPDSTHRYLYSAFGTLDGQHVWVESRRFLVGLASGLVLLLGMLWIYFPALRHPAVLLVVGVAVTASALYLPDPALLIGQAAVIGLVLAVLTVVLERYAGRRPVPASPSRVLMPHGSTAEQLALRLDVGSHSHGNTPTSPMTIPLPKPE